MERRSYGQFCTLARALDIVGERWTLLIVRDLLLGPKRFTDLLEGLPGIGRNLLSARLAHLEAEGVVRRAVSKTARRKRVYELTPDGFALAIAMGPLARWGARRLGGRRQGETFRPVWIAMAMAGSAAREATRGVHETYQLEVDDDAFHVRVEDGIVVPYEGRADDPTLVLKMDTDTLVGVVSRTISPPQAAAAGRIVIEGPPAAFRRCLAIFLPEALA